MGKFIRTKALLGDGGFKKLQNSTVAVFGIGGVGSYAAEALVRSGVKTVYIYDNDTVAQSNINRQLIADGDTVGRDKTAVAKERYLKINPDAEIIAVKEFITPLSVIPFEKFDYIIDAVDNVAAKLFLAENAAKSGVPIISVMGTGNKLRPELLKISDIGKTSYCPLCRVMRSQLKRRGIKRLTVVWSDEKPVKASVGEELRSTGRPSPSSYAFVPGAAGLMAAAYVVRELADKNTDI